MASGVYWTEGYKFEGSIGIESSTSCLCLKAIQKSTPARLVSWQNRIFENNLNPISGSRQRRKAPPDIDMQRELGSPAARYLLFKFAARHRRNGTYCTPSVSKENRAQTLDNSHFTDRCVVMAQFIVSVTNSELVASCIRSGNSKCSQQVSYNKWREKVAGAISEYTS